MTPDDGVVRSPWQARVAGGCLPPSLGSGRSPCWIRADAPSVRARPDPRPNRDEPEHAREHGTASHRTDPKPDRSAPADLAEHQGCRNRAACRDGENLREKVVAVGPTLDRELRHETDDARSRDETQGCADSL